MCTCVHVCVCTCVHVYMYACSNWKDSVLVLNVLCLQEAEVFAEAVYETDESGGCRKDAPSLLLYG